MARARRREPAHEQLTLEYLWGPAEQPAREGDDRESIRGYGPAALEPLAARPGRSHGRPEQLLLDPGGRGGDGDRSPDGGPGRGRPAGGGLPDQAGPAEHGPAAGRGAGAGRAGAADPGAGDGQRAGRAGDGDAGRAPLGAAGGGPRDPWWQQAAQEETSR